VSQWRSIRNVCFVSGLCLALSAAAVALTQAFPATSRAPAFYFLIVATAIGFPSSLAGLVMGLIGLRNLRVSGRSAFSILVWPSILLVLWLGMVVMPVVFHVFLDRSQAP
jgi:hypothetical protein